MIFVFIGLIAGSIPSIVAEARTAGADRHPRRCALVGAAALGASLLLLLVRETPGAAEQVRLSPAAAMAAGLILTTGAILPGLSTSAILFRLGWYAPMMEAFTTFDLTTLCWFGLGALVAAVSLVWLVRRLLKTHPAEMYALVIGLMIGSLIASIPRVDITWRIAIYVAAAGLGAACARLMARFEA